MVGFSDSVTYTEVSSLMLPDLGNPSARDPCAIFAMSIFSSTGSNLLKSRFCHSTLLLIVTVIYGG